MPGIPPLPTAEEIDALLRAKQTDLRTISSDMRAMASRCVGDDLLKYKVFLTRLCNELTMAAEGTGKLADKLKDQ
jgi:hypothetical protein